MKVSSFEFRDLRLLERINRGGFIDGEWRRNPKLET